MCRFRVTLVGRANVGKSTLFNRLTAGGTSRGKTKNKAKSTAAPNPKTNIKGKAIVDDRPGVTRDWREGAAQLADIAFTLIDTAGMEAEGNASLASRIRQQTEEVIQQSHLVLLMFDGRDGITALDRTIASTIHKLGVEVCVVANKCEGKLNLSGVVDGWQFGFGQAIAISAAHGEGLGDLYDVLNEALVEVKDASALKTNTDEAKDSDVPIRVAIIGRPNTGKSTLINRLLGRERMLTGPEAGITRDAIDLPFTYHGRGFILTDTAGVRRKARISDMLEKSMVEATRTAIRFAHVVIICVDAAAGLGKQDLALARLVADEGRAPLIAATMCDKWGGDKQRRKALQDLAGRLDTSMGQMRGVAVVAVSAITGEGMAGLLAQVVDVYSRWGMRLPTARLNQWLEGRLEAHPPPLAPHKRVRIRYMTQIKTRPPSFAFFLNRPSAVPAHYMRYLEGGLRDDFGLAGLPLRLLLRKGKNPYAVRDK